MPPESFEVIDLTDDTNSQSQRRRRSSDDFEIVSTVETINPLNQRLSITIPKNIPPRHFTDDDGLEVISTKTLSAQEKLKLIQARHARGEVVPNTNQHTYGRRYQYSRSDNIEYDIPPAFADPSRGRFLPEGLFEARFQAIYDDFTLDRVMNDSMYDTYGSKRVDPKKIRKPTEPAEAREGFTRTLTGSRKLVCVRCSHTLGDVDNRANTEYSKKYSMKVFVRGCGHVYCGVCVHALKALPAKQRACPVSDCKIPNARKRGLFCEVFL